MQPTHSHDSSLSPREWPLHPQMVQLIWSQFGEAQVDLFASHEFSHCQLYHSLTQAPLGTEALAHSGPRALCKYAFPPVSLLTLCKVREDEVTGPPWCIPLRRDLLSQGLGTIWHLCPDLWNFHV